MRNKWYLILAMVMIAVLALGACGGGDAAPTVAPAAPAEVATEVPGSHRGSC